MEDKQNKKFYESKQCKYYDKCDHLWGLSDHITPFHCDPAECNCFALREVIKNDNKDIQTK